ncbi:MAG: TolB-like protein/Tfp pilus assembly protein PilF [Candidatus Azotimanducaceae bacterium]|jgi:TolB-like protein/Tfp pilus assembly protein PilF
MIESIIAWLEQQEAAISAIAGLTAVLALVLGSLNYIFTRKEEPSTDPEGNTGKQSPLTRNRTNKSGATIIGVLHVSHAPDDVRDDAWAQELEDDLETYLSSASLLSVVVPAQENNSQTSQRTDLEAQGAKYLLQTRVSPYHESIRVNANLLDVDTNRHIWSQIYKRSIADFERGGDDVAHLITTQIAIPIIEAEVKRTLALNSEKLDSMTLTRLGYHKFLFRGHDPQEFIESRKLMDKAVELDQKNPQAWAIRALSISTAVMFGFSNDAKADSEIALQDAESAMRIAPSDPLVLYSRGWVAAYQQGYKYGIPFLKKAVELDPSNAHMRADYGFLLLDNNNIEEAKFNVKEAFRLSPLDPRQYIWEFFLAMISMKEGDIEKAIKHFNVTLDFESYLPAYLWKTVALAMLGKVEEAKINVKATANYFFPHYQKKDFLFHIAHMIENPELTAILKQITNAWPEIADTETQGTST